MSQNTDWKRSLESHPDKPNGTSLGLGLGPGNLRFEGNEFDFYSRF
jgi:hypothetical protein